MPRKAASILEPLKSLVRSRHGRRTGCRRRASSARSSSHYDVEAAGVPGRKLQHEVLHAMMFRSILSRTGSESEDEESDVEAAGSDAELPHGVSTAALRELLDETIQQYVESLDVKQKQNRLEQETTAMTKILSAEKLWQFRQALSVFVDADWQPRGIEGNIYRMAAFGAFERFRYLLATRGDIAYFVMLSTGSLVIFLIQLFAPPLYFLSTTLGFGISPGDRVHLKRLGDPDIPSIRKELAENWVSKLFGILFLIVFIINTIAVLMQEKSDWHKLDQIVHFLHNMTKLKVRRHWMSIGCFINCWVAVWCTLDAWLVLAGSTSPQGVIFDSLSLLFLYNLDDIGGDLGFFNDFDWHGTQLSWLHSEKGMQAYLKDLEKKAETEGRKLPEDFLTKAKLMDYFSKYASCLYWSAITICACCLVILPILFFTIPIISLTGESVGE